MTSPTSAPGGLLAEPTTSDQQAIFSQLNTWLASGETCWLITVLSTWGSSPRPAGTLLVWSKLGHRGSLSGGCIEEELLAQLAAGHWPGHQPEQVSYGVSAEDAYRLRLPCGGKMTLLLECLRPDLSTCQQVAALNQALNHRQAVLREINLTTGAWHWQHLEHRPADIINRLDDNTLQHYLGPSYQLLIIGANQIAEHMVQISALLNMRIAVCDPRPDAFQHWPHAWVSCAQDMPDDWLLTMGCDNHTAIVALAHDPRIDDMALLQALSAPAYYIGALGSQRNAATRRERLRQLGLTEAQIARLKAPIGIAIGSRTPAEIAVAICADLIAHQHRVAESRDMAELHGESEQHSLRAKP